MTPEGYGSPVRRDPWSAPPGFTLAGVASGPMGVPLWAAVLIDTVIAAAYVGFVTLLTGWSEEVWPPSKPWHTWVRFVAILLLLPVVLFAAWRGAR